MRVSRLRFKEGTLRRIGFVFVAIAIGVLLAVPAMAQNPTGTLSGRVTYDGTAMAGVTVQVASPNLQGTRTAFSSAGGDYILRFLPAGEYTVTFSLESFHTLTRELKISAAQSRRLDAAMILDTFAEEIEVIASYETISDSVEAQATFTQELVEKLPVARTINQAVLLAPGANSTGPNGRISISGAQSFENLFLINGVVVNENLRGQPLSLYIEDAIQETTTATSGVSAEYGRFQGGVVNMLTKSGGNEFSGSLRVNLTNDDWVSANNDLAPERIDDINTSYEATFGGRLLRDKLWFFLAGRDESSSETRTTDQTLIPYPYTESEKRAELKLTWSINQNHRLIGAYSEIDRKQTNADFGDIMDLASLNPNRADPQDITSLNYTGVLSDSFFVEAQWSERNYIIGIGSGGYDRSVIGGTLLRDRSRGSDRYHTPTFCAAPECGDEQRDNENMLLKGSWFLTTESAGTHDFVFGYDTFNDIRKVNNYQQASPFRIYVSDTIILDDASVPGGKSLYPVLAPYKSSLRPDGIRRGGYSYYQPIYEVSEGTNFRTNSFFVNDTWRLGNHWTFNLGLRYDQNDGKDSLGAKVSDDSRLSPRLGAAWDAKGNGDLIFNASYAHYVGALANGVANDGSAGGSPASIRSRYNGPCLNCEAYLTGDYSNLLTQEEVIAAWYQWWLDNGGYEDPPDNYYNSIPGVTPQILESLASPYTEEFALGVTKRLGTRGMVRVDLVHREGKSFYINRNEPGRTAEHEVIGTVDLTTIENDDGFYSRKYNGLHTNFQYRIGDRWDIGATWTLSRSRGNLNGEGSSGGPSQGTFFQYNEFKQASWSAPTGDLSNDARHKVRAWAVWEAISTSRHNLSISWLENYWSGDNYSAYEDVNVEDYMDNPGYETPPDDLNYYFSDRGEYHWDNVHRSDLSLNYSFKFEALGAGVEIFIQPEILNVFNEGAQDDGENTVDVIGDFNPFTESPVEGVHWEKASDFGQPSSENDFQMPRTYRFSVGIRF
ncbi:MAG: TonB-dependent receptor [bacterium]|nr:TonB-dependent receptor [bacterium]